MCVQFLFFNLLERCDTGRDGGSVHNQAANPLKLLLPAGVKSS